MKIFGWLLNLAQDTAPTPNQKSVPLMIDPISNERVLWIDQRLKILQCMYAELTRERHFYGSHGMYVRGAADHVVTERLSLQMEREVIVELLKEAA
jgi:hypothetical protein